MSKRRSTVYDAAALRLHPNGVRVRPTRVPFQFSSSKVINQANKSHQTVTGAWIATDAGGYGRIAKRRRITEDKNSEGTSVNDLPLHVDQEQGYTLSSQAAPIEVYKDTRANRRVAFNNDFTFLTGSREQTEDTVTSRHFQPSSDFLKCVHHFSSHYYDANGQLFDSARPHRQERWRRQKARKRKAPQSRPESEDETERLEDKGSEEDSIEGEELSGSKPKEKNRERKRAEPITDNRKDMYKAFDGSALICLGMLLQEHVASCLAEEPPSDWEDELEDYREDNVDNTANTNFHISESPRKGSIHTTPPRNQQPLIILPSHSPKGNDVNADSSSDDSETKENDSGDSDETSGTDD